MARLRTNNVFGTTTNNPLLIGGTTLSGAGLANLVAVTAPDVAVITLDPNRVHGAPEIVYVTAHTAANTSATILRGQEGTAARQHPNGTFWVHGATAVDFSLGTLGYAQKVADQTGITTEVDVTGLTTTVTVGSGRRVRVTADLLVDCTAADNTLRILIKEDGVNKHLLQTVGPLANQANTLHGWIVLTPSAGPHTYKLSALRAAGAGSMTVSGNAAFPASILVEDIGPA